MNDRKKYQLDFNEYIPMDLVYHSLVKRTPVLNRVLEIINNESIIGPLSWEKLESIDKDLADELRIYIEENKERLNIKYSQFGANLNRLAEKRKFKSSKSHLKVKPITTKRTTSNVKVKTINERKQEAKELLSKDIDTLGIKEIKSIIDYSDIDYVNLAPYWQKRKELMDRKIDYNKPKPIQAAKALLTFNFSGKSNPSKWIEYDQIIKAKLYCVKMGIEYLNNAAPDELPTILEQIKPNLDKVLQALNYKDINDINF